MRRLFESYDVFVSLSYAATFLSWPNYERKMTRNIKYLCFPHGYTFIPHLYNVRENTKDIYTVYNDIQVLIETIDSTIYMLIPIMY